MKVLIIGGVAGGAGAAARLRRMDENIEIILFEKDEYISFANCGLPYYIGGVIDDKEKLIIQEEKKFSKQNNIDVRTMSQVLSVDTKNKEISVKNHRTKEVYKETYNQLILSPGAAPIVPPIEGVEAEHVFTLRNIPDTVKIDEYIKRKNPKTAVIIGGGFIGVEMAENLMKRGVEVSVVDGANHVMANLDLDMAYDVHNYMRETGLSLYLGQGVSIIQKNQVITTKNNKIPADMVILSVGVSPATKFLEGSGISLGEKGEILVDEGLETNIKGVYALGDGASVRDFVTKKSTVIPLAGPANKQARIAADNVLGGEEVYKGSVGTSILKYFDLSVASTGASENTLKKEKIPYSKSLIYASSNASYYPGGEMIFIKVLFHKVNNKILGGQIVGKKGVDKRIDHLSNAILFGLSISDLSRMELAYAPPFSSAKDPVNIAGFLGENISKGLLEPYYLEDLKDIPLDDSVIRLDIREKDEYIAGNIKGYTLLPLSELRDRIDEIKLDKPIYIYCQSGKRGHTAQRILKGLGAKSVKNFIGGYRHYEAMKTDMLNW